jgi:HK97 family phage portal protein
VKLSTKESELTLDQLSERLQLLRSESASFNVTPETALKAPTVYAIVNRLASMFAQLPFSVVEDEGDGMRTRNVALPNHPVTRLVDRAPNGWQTAYAFKAHMMTVLLLHGNYLADKAGTTRGVPRWLVPIEGGTFRAEMDTRSRVTFEIQQQDGRSVTRSIDDVLYITSPVSLNGLHGLSPVKCCETAIALEISAQQFGHSLFSSSAVPSLILTRRGRFKDSEAANAFKRAWEALFRRKRSTAVLEGDEWDVKQVQMSNEDSQFLDTRKLQRSIIAGMYNVPPHMVGDLERATFSNISSQALEVLMYTLSPWLECIEGAISRSLLTPEEVDRGLFCRFDTKRLMRGDLAATADFIARMRQWGVMSANEGRSMLEMNAREDDSGDDYLTPLNMVDQDGETSGAVGGGNSGEDGDGNPDDGTDSRGLRSVG